MLMSPAGIAIACMTVMLWILWGDSVRSKRPSQPLYVLRVMLYLIMSGVLIVNMVRFRFLYSTTARVLTVAAAAVGLAGAIWFFRKLTRRPVPRSEA